MTTALLSDASPVSLYGDWRDFVTPDAVAHHIWVTERADEVV